MKAIGKLYKGREQTMTPFNEELFLTSFEFMSIETQFSDSWNETNVYPPYVMGYGQPSQNNVMGSSSTGEENGMSSYSPFTQMSYHVPYQMQGGFDPSTWMNLKYPIHVKTVDKTQEIYSWHVQIFNQGLVSWYQYSLQQ